MRMIGSRVAVAALFAAALFAGGLACQAPGQEDGSRLEEPGEGQPTEQVLSDEAMKEFLEALMAREPDPRWAHWPDVEAMRRRKAEIAAQGLTDAELEAEVRLAYERLLAEDRLLTLYRNLRVLDCDCFRKQGWDEIEPDFDEFSRLVMTGGLIEFELRHDPSRDDLLGALAWFELEYPLIVAARERYTEGFMHRVVGHRSTRPALRPLPPAED